MTDDLHEVIDETLRWLKSHFSVNALAGVGHRVVHGGDRFSGPEAISGDMLDAVEALVPLAPHSEGNHPMRPTVDLTGKRGLVVGIANESSIAHGCARAFHAAGADLAVTYLNAKAEPYVRPLAEALKASIIVPCDVRVAGELEALFDRLTGEWGRLDFLFHSIAFAPREDLHTSIVARRKASPWRWMSHVILLSAWLSLLYP